MPSMADLPETVKSSLAQDGVRRLPHEGRGCRRAGQADIAASDLFVSRPLLMFDRATTSMSWQMTRIATSRFCLPRLLLRRWFPYIFLVVPKTASVMLRWWYSSMNLSWSSLCILVILVISPHVWLSPCRWYGHVYNTLAVGSVLLAWKVAGRSIAKNG